MMKIITRKKVKEKTKNKTNHYPIFQQKYKTWMEIWFEGQVKKPRQQGKMLKKEKQKENCWDEKSKTKEQENLAT